MFGAIDQQWQQVYGLNGQTNSWGTSGTDSGTPNTTEVNYGELGYYGDPNNEMGSNGQNDSFLKNLGYTGGSPYILGQTSGGENASTVGPETGIDPAFIQWAKDRNITFKVRPDGAAAELLQGFGPDGQPIGTPFRRKRDSDSQFGTGAMLMMGGMGLSALGAAGAFGGAANAGAGAANGAWDVLPGAVGQGSSAIGYTAPTAVGGVSSISPEIAMSGMDMAADAGMAASGFGGEAAGAANGMWDVAGGFGGVGSGGAGGGSGGLFGTGITGSQALNFGGSLANGLIGAYTGNKALDRQQDATDKANALWEPYRQFGVENLGRANGLLKNPGSINQDPQHQFLLQQGMQARDRSAASRGNLYSGQQMKGAERFGQDLGNASFDRILGRYTGAAQLGATGTTNISNNLTNLGNAGAANSLYQGQVANNAINNGLGQYNWSQYTNDLKKQPY
jgi:hypothetical protein